MNIVFNRDFRDKVHYPRTIVSNVFYLFTKQHKHKYSLLFRFVFCLDFASILKIHRLNNKPLCFVVMELYSGNNQCLSVLILLSNLYFPIKYITQFIYTALRK